MPLIVLPRCIDVYIWLGAFLYITGSFTFGSTAGMFVDQLRNPGRPLRALWSNPGTDHTTVRAGMWSSATAMAHSSAALAHKASAKSERFVVHTVIYRNAPSHFEQPSRGQISGAPLTYEMILGVLDTSDMCSFAWYSSQLANWSS